MAAIKNGQDYKHVEVEEGYPVIGSGGPFTHASEYMYDKESVLLGRKGTIDKPQYMETPFWTVDTLFYTVIKDGNNPKFLFYRLCLIDWKLYNEASGVPSLNARTIENIEISTPAFEEQVEISRIINSLDEDIKAHEAKLAKIRNIKQGMMQELLTGRVRLV